MLGLLAGCRLLHLRRDTMLLMLTAAVLAYQCLYHTGWIVFTADAIAHATYVELAAHPRVYPVGGDSAALRHPPTYYYPAAALYRLGEAAGMSDPLLLARHFSMALLFGFWLIATALVRRVLAEGTPGFWAALLLLLFWPLGITMGGRLTCDVLLYMTQAAVLFFLVAWLQDKNVTRLSAAFLCAGFALLAKNTGVLMLGLDFGVLALAAYEYRRAPATLLRWHLAAAILFALACWGLTAWHAWVTDYIGVKPHYTGMHSLMQWLDVFWSFNPFIYIYDTSLGLSHERFWNMLLHTFLLSTFFWKSTEAEIALNILQLAVLLYALEGTRHLRGLPAREKGPLLLLGAYTLMGIAGMFYMRMRTGNIEYADARYIYPAVIAVTLWYGRVVQGNRANGRQGAVQLGLGIAVAFALASAALFILQALTPLAH